MVLSLQPNLTGSTNSLLDVVYWLTLQVAIPAQLKLPPWSQESVKETPQLLIQVTMQSSFDDMFV